VSFIAGIALEITHLHSDDAIRGLIFFLVGIIVLIPGGLCVLGNKFIFIAYLFVVYAVVHVYLAAKKVGRVRFSNVWFFR
jgi:hypothetical protein